MDPLTSLNDTLPPSSPLSSPPWTPDVSPSIDLLALPGLYTISTPPCHSRASSPAREAHDDHPASEMSLIPSSPVRTLEDARRKAAKRREIEAQAAKEAAATKEAQATVEVCQEVLRYLANHERTFGDLVAYVSDGQNYAGNARYWGFFSVEGRVERVLDAWVSSQNSNTGRECVHEWAVRYVKKLVHTEGDAATRSKLLQTSAMEIDESFALDFSLGNLHTRLRELCPTAMSVLEAFSTTTRQAREMKEASQKRKDNVRDSTALSIVHYPHATSIVHHNRSLDSSWVAESKQ